jgi:predicted nucleotidyltransferase
MTQREKEILNSIIDVLIGYFNSNRIILFGSRTRQKFSRNTDFDLAVDNEEKVNIRLERKIKEKIEGISGLYKVDIIFLNSVDQEFKEIILKTRRRIYERNS